MRYNLQIRNINESKRIILPLISTYPRSFGHFEAVIDTGAPKTILSAADGWKLKIPFNNLEKAQDITGLGKGSFPSLEITKFSMILKSSEEKITNINFPLIAIDVPRIQKMDDNTKRHAFTIPTLIGLDFLEANKFKLFIDLKNNIAYLED